MFSKVSRLKQDLDKLIGEKMIKPMIVVALDNHSHYFHSWYENSPATGPWLAVNGPELVNFIDKNYRTKPNRENRAIAGYGSGGYGALNLAINHNQLFSIVYAMNPWNVMHAEGDVRYFAQQHKNAHNYISNTQMQTWSSDTQFFAALSSAFLPQAEGKLRFVTQFDMEIHGPAMSEKVIISQIKNNPNKLAKSKIGFDVAEQEYFAYYQTDQLSYELDKLKIDHEYKVYREQVNGKPYLTIKQNMLPFVSRNFQ